MANFWRTEFASDHLPQSSASRATKTSSSGVATTIRVLGWLMIVCSVWGLMHTTFVNLGTIMIPVAMAFGGVMLLAVSEALTTLRGIYQRLSQGSK